MKARRGKEVSSSDARAGRELERLITKRHDPRDGEALLEPSYAESVRRYNAKLQAANREMWTQFHREQAERHRATLERLIQVHERRAEELLTKEGESSHVRSTKQD
jgi:hypothetical protein